MSIPMNRSDPLSALEAADYAFTRSAWIATTPAVAFGLISDVSMIGTWSPSASDVAYEEGGGPWPGSWFRGRNRSGDREWASRSQVVESVPGSVFAFVVDDLVRWRWSLRAEGAGTVVEQSWQLLRLEPVLGNTREDLETLRDHMAASAEQTLVSLSRWVSEQRAAPRD
ncbi:SRPBCC family protein [Streptomyces asoensis]|uniref:SRPBCC family protein n=1 Tax=Streptomyces asoensis TaxID=249586 RepID=A0A6M4X0F1_9ACTN|nr:SRPBCC family protein [Streptomyces asoensis]QJT06280.1 SRPBCC family protein [Streptomyces asoensis]